MNASPVEEFDDVLGLARGDVESDEGAVPSHIIEEWSLLAHPLEFNFDEGGGVLRLPHEVLVRDGVLDGSVFDEVENVFSPDVVKGVGSGWLVVRGAVVAVDLGGVAEHDEVGRAVQVPVVMTPEAARYADTLDNIG